MPRRKLITEDELEELKKVLSYDPATGIFRWRVDASNCARSGSIAGAKYRGRGHRQVQYKRRQYYLHRLAWAFMTGEYPDFEIDHINQEKADNRFCNLRPATRGQNNANRPVQANNAHGFKGVCFVKARGKYIAQINFNKKLIRLGHFTDAESAARAYDKAAVELFGEFACLNFC
jgi:hypothetical protein